MVNIDELIEADGLFHTEFSEEYSFTWRLLTIKEYKVFRGLRESGTLPEHSLYLEVFKRCYVRNIEFLNQRIPVGMLISIGEMIMWLSGDCELETLKEDIHIARSIYPADSVNEQMKRVILTAFTAYKIEEVENWTRPRLIRNFVMSEQILGWRGTGYQPLDINEIKLPHEIQEEDDRPNVSNVAQMNFERQAALQRKELGVWAEEDAIELEGRRSSKLTVEDAQKLDKITAARGA